MSVCSVSR